MGILVKGKWIADDQRLRNSDDGNFIRPTASFRGFVTADGSSGFAAELNRYHLYVALSCPGPIVVLLRALKGLEDTIRSQSSRLGRLRTDGPSKTILERPATTSTEPNISPSST